jgi:replication factor A1
MQENKELLEEMSEKSGKTIEEITELVEKKVKKFSGLLTKEGATFMIQKELGLKKNDLTTIKINDLKEGMKDFETKGIIKTIYPIKKFEKGGKKGKILSFLIEDDTGIIRITLWNDQIGKYNLTQGSEIKILNGFVTSYNERKQLSLGYNGNIEIIEKKEEEFEKINDLKSGLNNINVVGRLIRKFPCKEFENQERKGKVCNFQFGDETALLRATAWNEKADEIQEIENDKIIELKNAYTKEGMYGIELHLGYNSIIQKSEKEIPNTIDILKENVEEKKINALVENKNAIINVKVKEIKQGILFFNSCEKCGKKIVGNICEKCGEVKEIKKTVLNINVEDETGEIITTFFGNSALNLIEMTQEEFEKETNEKSNQIIIDELNKKIIGKKIKLLGYEKNNSFSGENEFSVREIIN